MCFFSFSFASARSIFVSSFGSVDVLLVSLIGIPSSSDELSSVSIIFSDKIVCCVGKHSPLLDLSHSMNSSDVALLSRQQGDLGMREAQTSRNFHDFILFCVCFPMQQ